MVAGVIGGLQEKHVMRVIQLLDHIGGRANVLVSADNLPVFDFRIVQQALIPIFQRKKVSSDVCWLTI